MKKQRSIILGTLSLCCLFWTYAEGSELEATPRPRPVYATLVQTETSSFTTNENITVPLGEMLMAKGVAFDKDNSTFTLPRGIYSLHFQFTMNTKESISTPKLGFTHMHLDLNNGDTLVPVVWNVAPREEDNWAHFSGSAIFNVESDNTKIRFVLNRTDESGSIRFSLPRPTTTLDNHAVRITLHEIDDIACT